MISQLAQAILRARALAVRPRTKTPDTNNVIAENKTPAQTSEHRSPNPSSRSCTDTLVVIDESRGGGERVRGSTTFDYGMFVCFAYETDTCLGRGGYCAVGVAVCSRCFLPLKNEAVM